MGVMHLVGLANNHAVCTPRTSEIPYVVPSSELVAKVSLPEVLQMVPALVGVLTAFAFMP